VVGFHHQHVVLRQLRGVAQPLHQRPRPMQHRVRLRTCACGFMHAVMARRSPRQVRTFRGMHKSLGDVRGGYAEDQLDGTRAK